MRALILLGVVALGLFALFAWTRPLPAPGAAAGEPLTPARLAFVATAQQQGVVGYRDPAGAISPDGRQVAYSEGRYLRVVPVAGGMSPVLPPTEGQIRGVGWLDSRRILVEDAGGQTRWVVFDLADHSHQPLVFQEGSNAPPPSDLRQIAVSRDGTRLAAVVTERDGPVLWTMALDGSSADRQSVTGRPSSPTFLPSGGIACVLTVEGRPRLSTPCGATAAVTTPDVDVIGPLAFAPDGRTAYFASPNPSATVDLWSIDLPSRRAAPLTAFARDSYAPSVAEDGTVLFKTQTYRTIIAETTERGPRQLTTFQAETPWWHPAEPLISVTYGTWRRVLDDAKYPDIAQEIGVIDADRTEPSSAPRQVIAQSDSEDQAMAWSPNGRWIALHSHREMSDDIWLRPADGRAPDRRITMLGRGAEVGWPRWSPDGRAVLLDGANTLGRSVVYTIGVDQESGQVTSDLREIATPGFAGEMMHAEWMPDGRRIAAVAREGAGLHALVIVSVEGGMPAVVHRVATEHDFPGLTVSPDGGELAFVAPAADGFYQVFRVPVAGGAVEQLTVDPSHKTQPAWSPDGKRLAYTVWDYTATFWTFRP